MAAAAARGARAGARATCRRPRQRRTAACAAGRRPGEVRDGSRDEDTVVVDSGLSNIVSLEGFLSQGLGIVSFSLFLAVFFIVPQIAIAIGLPVFYGQDIEWCWERLFFGNECGSMEVYVDIDGSTGGNAEMSAAAAPAAEVAAPTPEVA